MRPSPHRATIAHLVDEGCSAAEIARRLHINDRTVRRIVAQYRERGHIYHFQNQGVQELSMFLGFGRPDAQRSSKEEQSGKMSEASGSSSCRPPLGHRVDRRENFHGRGRAQQPKPAAVAPQAEKNSRKRRVKTISLFPKSVMGHTVAMGPKSLRRMELYLATGLGTSTWVEIHDFLLPTSFSWILGQEHVAI
uniref:Helix-turn-helix domain-containing protein n=1 Tax=Haemonchus contortus TaxID=6289 RepID=A0A7I5E9N5_HAECO